MKFRHVVVTAALGVMIGLVSGAVLFGQSDAPVDPAVSSTPDATVQAADTFTEIALLRDELAFERDARVALAQELDQIWDEVAELSDSVAAAAASAQLEPNAKSAPGSKKSPNPDQWIDLRSMIAAGVSKTDAERLRELYEAQQLEELYLRNRAAREGWVATGRFRTEMRELRQQLRSELGDEDYDWVLWASGHKNRVEINKVLQNSAAELAGLQRGDIIVRYDGELMLNPRDVRQATLRGRLGDSVAIDVLRAGQSMRFYTSAGPLGTQLGPARQQPDT